MILNLWAAACEDKIMYMAEVRGSVLKIIINSAYI